MKKLITVILIMALLLPAAALAAEPIVGVWNMHIDLKEYPELKSTYGDFDSLSDLYFFNEDGSISSLEGYVTGGACTPTFTGVGRWSKNGSKYNVSIMGVGETTATVSGAELHLKVPNVSYDIAMKLRRLVTFNPYADYVY